MLAGIVNNATESIEVRKEPIIDFSEGEKANWKLWITLLCRIVGEPVRGTE